VASRHLTPAERSRPLRPFSIWAIKASLCSRDGPDTLRKKLGRRPLTLPQGITERGWPPALVFQPRKRSRTAPPCEIPWPQATSRTPPWFAPCASPCRNFKKAVSEDGRPHSTLPTRLLLMATACFGGGVDCLRNPQADAFNTTSMGLDRGQEKATRLGHHVPRPVPWNPIGLWTANDPTPNDCPYPAADELAEDVQSIGAQRFQEVHPADLVGPESTSSRLAPTPAFWSNLPLGRNTAPCNKACELFWLRCRLPR